MTEMMQYFPLLYQLHSQQRYLIWISNEKDSIAVDAGGFVPSFRDLTSLRQYANQNHFNLETEEPVLHDLDWVATWLMEPVVLVDCKEALNAWNLFSDLAASMPRLGVAFNRIDSQFQWIYNKLFFGN